MNESATTTPKACELVVSDAGKRERESQAAGSECRLKESMREICLPETRPSLTAHCCWPATVHATHSAATASASYSRDGRVETAGGPDVLTLRLRREVQRQREACPMGQSTTMPGFTPYFHWLAFSPAGGFQTKLMKMGDVICSGLV